MLRHNLKHNSSFSGQCQKHNTAILALFVNPYTLILVGVITFIHSGKSFKSSVSGDQKRCFSVEKKLRFQNLFGFK